MFILRDTCFMPQLFRGDDGSVFQDVSSLRVRAVTGESGASLVQQLSSSRTGPKKVQTF